MLKKKVEDICNRQVEREGYSSNLYLAMASWAETQGYSGIADWLYAQSEEERMHMLKFIKYINERGGKAVLPAFKQPPVNYKSVEDLFKEVLKHEQFVTASINEIYSLALQEKDFNTNSFVQWFVTEQVEEEKNASSILESIKKVGDHGSGLLMIDRQLAARDE